MTGAFRYRELHLMAICSWCQGEHDEYTAEEVIGGFHCPHCYGENEVKQTGPTTVKITAIGEN